MIIMLCYSIVLILTITYYSTNIFFIFFFFAFFFETCLLHLLWIDFIFMLRSAYQIYYNIITQMFHSNYLLNLHIMLALVAQVLSQWIPYTRFDGYIPSYTYPIQLNAGDSLRGYLSWPGTQDLDIYLYTGGSDLLSRSVWLDREYSPNLNPQDLVYTIGTSGLYYLRVDLYSSVPTRYNFQISVNGQPIQSFTDTVITVTSGRTAQQFQVSGPCQVRVAYDGPIHNLYLFAPGADVITGTPVASETTSVNPKYMTHLLTSGGKWNIIIHHMLTSTTALIPFSIVVQTNQGANQCLNLCSSIPFSAGLISGTTKCYCKQNFIWVSSNSTCSIDCSAVNTTGDVGPRVSGTSDQCQCLKANYIWNSANLKCAINCAALPLTAGQNGLFSCFCVSGFEWAGGACVRNCTADVYAVRVNTGNTNACDCVSGFVWDAASQKCVANCASIQYATTPVPSSTVSCQCVATFSWSATPPPGCYITCSAYNSSTPSPPTINECICPIQSYDWNSTSLSCYLNCSKVQYSVGHNGSAACACSSQFQWISVTDLCEIKCTELPWTTTRTSFNVCACRAGYIWDASLLRCVVNCSTVPFANANTVFTANTTQVCGCQALFDWVLQPPTSYCTINCSQIPQASPLPSPAPISSCQCPSKKQWNLNYLQCQLNCSKFSHTNMSLSDNTSTFLTTSCQCQTDFQWNPTIQQCEVICVNFNHTQINGYNGTYIGNGIVNGTTDQCVCDTGYFWEQGSGCVEDGTVMVWGEAIGEWVGEGCGGVMSVQVKLPGPNTAMYNLIQAGYYQSSDPTLFIITSDVQISSAAHFAVQQRLTLTLTIIKPLQSSSMTLLLASTNPSVQPLSVPLTFPNSLAPSLYSGEQCRQLQSIKNLIRFMPVAAYFAMGAGVATFSHKIVGLEMFGVLQLAYFTVPAHYQQVNLYIRELVGLRIASGANFAMYNETAQPFYKDLPRVLKKDASIHAYFINNYNVMCLILLLLIVVFSLLYAAISLYRYSHKKAKNNKKQQNLSNEDTQRVQTQSLSCPSVTSKTLQKKIIQILKQGILTLSFFSIFNIAFSWSIFLRYCQNCDTNQSALTLSYIGLYLTVIIIVLLIADIVRVGSSVGGYGEFKLKFKKNWFCRDYVAISFIYRIVLAMVIASQLDRVYGSLFPIFICISFLMFNLINLPFSQNLHNFRANLIHVTQLITLIIANYYRSMESNTPLVQKSHQHAPAIILFVFIAFSVIFSLLVTIYEGYCRIKYLIGKCKKGKVDNQDNRDDAEKELNMEYAEGDHRKKSEKVSRHQVNSKMIQINETINVINVTEGPLQQNQN